MELWWDTKVTGLLPDTLKAFRHLVFYATESRTKEAITIHFLLQFILYEDILLFVWMELAGMDIDYFGVGVTSVTQE